MSKKGNTPTDEVCEGVAHLNIEDDKMRVQQAIEDLRSLVSGEKNLKVKMDDKFMLRYLRASDFNPKEAFNKMEKVYKFKVKYKDYYGTKSLTELKDNIEQNIVLVSEEYNHDGRRVLIMKLGDIDTSKNNIKDLAQLMEFWSELLLDEEESQKNGIHYIIDMGGLPYHLLKFITPKAATVYALREEMRPWKQLDLHIVNTSKFFQILMKIVQPFLGAKFKQHIHIHGKDWPSLHKFINPENLAQEHGGSKVEYDVKIMHKYLFENADKIEELVSLGYINQDNNAN
ncbi:hypothetical protein L9F63_001563 [Diploptera punctata]|uniref:CRAL-TRIO domain-containing protein n=1 Tax=Diploptera punctata TaxID=6984 RepID=A0AAD8A3W3_DIPPU|nr:hypothetical protein L9F63_001563 [Diploptera punctata]